MKKLKILKDWIIQPKLQINIKKDLDFYKTKVSKLEQQLIEQHNALYISLLIEEKLKHYLWNKIQTLPPLEELGQYEEQLKALRLQELEPLKIRPLKSYECLEKADKLKKHNRFIQDNGIMAYHKVLVSQSIRFKIDIMRDPFLEVNLMDLEEKFIHKETIIKMSLNLEKYIIKVQLFQERRKMRQNQQIKMSINSQLLYKLKVHKQ